MLEKLDKFITKTCDDVPILSEWQLALHLIKDRKQRIVESDDFSEFKFRGMTFYERDEVIYNDQAIVIGYMSSRGSQWMARAVDPFGVEITRMGGFASPGNDEDQAMAAICAAHNL